MALEIGKRYWLDSWKEQSGVYTGTDGIGLDGKIKNDGYNFKDIEGKPVYEVNEDGTIWFSNLHAESTFPMVNGPASFNETPS